MQEGSRTYSNWRWASCPSLIENNEQDAPPTRQSGS